MFLNQVHGTAVATINPATPDGTEADAEQTQADADAEQQVGG